MYIRSFSYFDYNANPRGTNTGDCQTRAIATALGWSWKDARKLLRKFGDNWYNKKHIVEQVLTNELNCQIVPVADNITVGEFCDTEGASGTYLVLCKDPRRQDSHTTHLVCVINGTIYDTWNSSKCIVLTVYKPTGTYRTQGFADTSDIPEHINKLAEQVRSEFRSWLGRCDISKRITNQLPANQICECTMVVQLISIHNFNIAIEVKIGFDIKGTYPLWHKVKKKFNISFEETDMYDEVVQTLPDEIKNTLENWEDTLIKDVVDRFNASTTQNSSLRKVPKSQTLIKAYNGIDPDLKPYVVNMETFCGYTCAVVRIEDDLNILVMCKSAKDLSNSIRICRKYDKSFWKDYYTKRINCTPYGFTFCLDYFTDTYKYDKYDFQEFYEQYQAYEKQKNEPNAEPLEYYFGSRVPQLLT